MKTLKIVEYAIGSVICFAAAVAFTLYSGYYLIDNIDWMYTEDWMSVVGLIGIALTWTNAYLRIREKLGKMIDEKKSEEK